MHTIRLMPFMTIILLGNCMSQCAIRAQDSGIQGKWNAAIETEGGLLHFGLEIERTRSGFQGWLVNEPERIKIPKIKSDANSFIIDIDHFDSKIEFRQTGKQLQGKWTKLRGKSETAVVPFTASRTKGASNADDPKSILGKWKVRFSGEQDDSVAIIKRLRNSNQITATFLTTTGDYRYLAGHLKNNELTLSCFDGAHAFLFKARFDQDKKLSGKFYSGNWWQTSWQATKDDNAELPDAFKQTSFSKNNDLGSIRFPDVDGRQRSLLDEQFAGKARIIYVFGSWCPNCHDAAEFMVELDNEYRVQGLSILGLAFELTGDFDRDVEQIKKYKLRHKAKYPVLIAGLSDKKVASQALPFLDKVRSYPTTLFIDGNGEIQAVHTGFSGPATGEAYEKLKKQFKSRIEMLLK